MPKKRLVEDVEGEFEKKEESEQAAVLSEPDIELYGGLRMTADVVKRWLSVHYERKSNAFPAVLIEPGSIPSKKLVGLVLSMAFRAAMNGGYVYVPEEYGSYSFDLAGLPESRQGNYFAFLIEK